MRYWVSEEAICKIYQTARTLLSPWRCCRPFLERFLISVKLHFSFIDLMLGAALLILRSFGEKVWDGGIFGGSPPFKARIFIYPRWATMSEFKYKLTPVPGL